MRLIRRAATSLAIAIVVAWRFAASASACSPPFEEPTIRALGPDQVVVVGTIGERVAGGRVFHVERWFNGGVPTARILIAFKEGEPVGDCSYPVSAGQTLIIAPNHEPDGRLSADLTTLQANPTDPRGQRFVAEAMALFGPGVVPPAVEETAVTTDTETGAPGAGVIVVGGLVLAVGLVFAGVVVVAARRQRPHA